MKMKNVAVAVAMLGLAGSFSANAEVQLDFAQDLKIDIGTDQFDFNGDGDGITEIFDNMSFSNLLATSFYDLNAGALTGTFSDTNIDLSAQFSDAVSYTSLDGQNQTQFVYEDGFDRIDKINPLVTVSGDDTEGYGESPQVGGGSSGWWLEVDFKVSGSIDFTDPDALPDYDDGEFTLIYNDTAGTRYDVLVADFYSDIVAVGNLETSAAVEMKFDIDWVRSGFWFASNGGNYTDLATMINQSSAPDLFALSYQINPAQPNAGTLYAIDSDTAIRQAPLAGQGYINVSEPSTLMMFGLTLLGLAGFSRRKRSK